MKAYPRDAHPLTIFAFLIKERTMHALKFCEGFPLAFRHLYYISFHYFIVVARTTYHEAAHAQHAGMPHQGHHQQLPPAHRGHQDRDQGCRLQPRYVTHSVYVFLQTQTHVHAHYLEPAPWTEKAAAVLYLCLTA